MADAPLEQALAENVDQPVADDEPVADPEATVAHIVVAIEDDADQDAVSHALNEGLSIIHATYRGLHASLRYESPLPSPESAPFGVLCALEVVANGALEPRWGLGFYALNNHDLTATQPLADADLQRLDAAVLHAATFDPTMLVFDLQRQAVTAANRAGDSRAAVVMAATACETFIDLVLGALLWQEGYSPDRAAGEMERYRDTKERMDRLLATRLKGRWDYRKVAALRDWREKVAKRRNRVVHGGALPSSWSAQESINAMFAFFSMVLDRLCDDVARKRYNMAALLICQRSGLEARGKWNAAMRATADRADELDMRGVFARWFNATTELRLPIDDRRKIDSSKSYLAYVVCEDGQAYWIERNEPASLARLAEPQEVVSDWVTAAFEQDHPKPGWITSFDTNPRYITVGPWLPDHHLVPGLAIMLDPTMWYKPRAVDWEILGPAT